MRKKRVKKNRKFWTGTRLTYLVLFFVSFSLAFFMGGVVPYSLFFIVLAIPVFSFLQIVTLGRNLSFSQKLNTKTITKGQEAIYIITVENHSILTAPFVRIMLSDNKNLALSQNCVTMSILPCRHEQCNVFVKFTYRGEYTFGIDSFVVSDFFRLFRLKYKINSHFSVLVYPKLAHLSNFLARNHAELQSGAMLQKGTEETSADTRKYVIGDPLNRVHWNLTAQKNEMISKLYENENETSILFYLDTSEIISADVFLSEDALVEACLAAVWHLLLQEKKIVFARAQDGVIKTINVFDRNDFQHLYAALAKVVFGELDTSEKFLTFAGAYTYSIIFTAKSLESGFFKDVPLNSLLDLYFLDDKVEENQNSPNKRLGSAQTRIIKLVADADAAVMFGGASL